MHPLEGLEEQKKKLEEGGEGGDDVEGPPVVEGLEVGLDGRAANVERQGLVPHVQHRHVA